MTIRQHLKDLAKRRADLNRTIASFEAERDAALAALPEFFGHNNLADFVKEVTAAHKAGGKTRKAYTPRTPRRRRAAKVSGSPATATQPPSPQADAAAAPVPPVAASIAPVGTDLNDPSNFGQLPDMALLQEVSAPGAGYYDRLSQALNFARQVLGTSKVRAAIWREWRTFEQKAGDILRDRHKLPDPEQT